jgi:hypothetical protein
MIRILIVTIAVAAVLCAVVGLIDIFFFHGIPGAVLNGAG